MNEPDAEQKILALQNSVNALAKVVNEQAVAMEKLGKVHGLEYSQDCKDWVSSKKLAELRKNPRESVPAA